MKNKVKALFIIGITIIVGNVSAQNNFVGTWEGLGFEPGDQTDYSYISKMFVDQQDENDTLYCKIYLQALNGKKIRNYVAFKALLEGNDLHVLNNTIKPKGVHVGNKKFSLALEGTELVLQGDFKTPDRPSLYFKLTKTDNAHEKTVDQALYSNCLKEGKSAAATIEEMKEMSGPCLAGQLDLQSAKYSYNDKIDILAIKIDGLMPINLVMDNATAEGFLNSKEQTSFQFKAIEEVRLSNLAFEYEIYEIINGIDMLAPVSVIVSNPGLKQSISYPQPELETVNLKSIFEDIISTVETREP